MDKNMINIDDLLRQRLGDAEEQERPGAWANMRDVLDQQMPVGKVPAAATNWRRMFAALAGIALLAAVSVGGYQMSHTINTTGDIAENNTTPTPEEYTAATTGLAGTAINSLPDTRVEAEIAAQPAPATDAATSSISTQNSTINTNTVRSVTQSNIATNTNNNTLINKDLSSINETKKLNTNTQKQTNNTNNNNKSNTNTIITASSNTSTNKMSNKPAQPVANTTGNANDNTQKVAEPIIAKNNETAGKNIATDNNKAEQSTGEMTPKDMQQNKVVSEDANYKEVPVQKIVRKQKIGDDGLARMDTMFTEDGVRKIKQPSDNNGPIAKNTSDNEATGSEIMPASAAPKASNEASSETAGMQKLGDHKVKSKKMKNYNPHRFEEMVQNAKYRMGNVKFYPGIVGGANIAFNGNAGVQIGLALNTKVSDRWSILTEVKYAYRWNGGSNKVKMQDDYITNVDPTVVNGNAVYTYDSMEHYFNFNNYGLLDIPLILSYKSDRVTFMAGVDFNYNFKINSLQEFEQVHTSEKPRVSTSNPVFNTDKTILLSDFAPSMNLGPIIGVGYQVSPAWKVDMRLSKPMWNNASTTGQKEIAKQLYSKPQVQFNLNYKFPSRKPYKRKR